MTKRKHINSKSLNDFIREMNVQAGTLKVPNSVIFYEYWLHSGKLNKIVFFRLFSKHFKSFRYGSKRGYYLNESFSLSRENIIKSRLFDRDYNIKRRLSKMEKQNGKQESTQKV